MLNALRYFQAIVECGSFTEAAEVCHISQSAISQQMQSLESELGFKLFDRQKRKSVLTQAGRHFYQKSLVIVADYERMVRETRKIAKGSESSLKIGVLKTYGGEELQLAIASFSRKYPEVNIKVITANHDALRDMMHHDEADIVINDQRLAFSNASNNVILQNNHCYIEIAKDNPIAKMEYVSAEDLKNVPCIIVCDENSAFEETKYYRTVFRFQGEFLFADTIKDARLMVVSNRGFFPVDGKPVLSHFSETIARVPYYVGQSHFQRNLCVFWLKDNSGYYVEEFAEILQEQFQKEK